MEEEKNSEAPEKNSENHEEKPAVHLHEDNKVRTSKKSLIQKIPRHNWAITTYIFAILVIFLLISSFTGGVTGKAISDDKAGELLVGYFNSITGGGVELVSVDDIGNLYEVIVSFEGQEMPVYITKDGKYIGSMSSVAELEAQNANNTNTQPTDTPTAYSEEDLEKLGEFMVCLEEAEFVIYGANWCGYTQAVVELFGGFDTISSGIYVECTEEEELCSSEEVSGYPTIKLAGEAYTGQRTLEGFAEATGCSAPVLEGSVGTTNSEASCG